MAESRHHRLQRKRRIGRIAVLLSSLLVLGFLLSGLGAGAASPVRNPGNVNAELNLSLLTLGENQLGIRTLVRAPGRIDAAGTLSIAAEGVSFVPRTLRLDVGQPDPLRVVIETIPVTSFRGHIDPRTGIALLGGVIVQRWRIPGSGSVCTVGPIRIGAGTGVPGSRRYDETSGTVTVIDPTPEIDQVSDSAPGCVDLALLVNEEMSLPITTTTTTTTSSSSTTTIAPSSTTTIDPVRLAAMPAPVPSIVLSVTLDPPPSSRSTRVSTSTTVQVPPPTTAKATSVRPAANRRPTATKMKKPAPRPEREEAPETPRTVQSERIRRALERARRARTVSAPPPSNFDGSGEWFPSLDDIDGNGVPDARRVEKSGIGHTLRAIPASAVRASSSGPWLVVPLAGLVGLGYVGFRLIGAEVARTRRSQRPGSRHRRRSPFEAD